MATESLASFTEFLKILHVEDTVRETISNNVALYKHMRQRAQIKKFEGRQIRYPLQKARQFGVGWVDANSSSLPTATVSDGLEPVYNARNMYAVGEINDEVIEDSMTSRGSYERALEMVRDDLMLSQKQMINAAMYDDGRARIAALPAADDTGTTVTVSQPIQIFLGQLIDVIDATNNSTRLLDGVGVTAVDHVNNTFSHNGAAMSGSDAADYVVQNGTVSAAGAQRAIFGLEAGTDSGNPTLANYGGIDRTTTGNEMFQGTESGNSGTNRQITERLVQNHINLMRRRTNHPVDDLALWTNWNVVSEYWDELVQDRVLQVEGSEAMKLAGGFDKGVAADGAVVGRFHGQVPIIADTVSTANTIYTLNMATWRIYQTHDPELIDRDGSVLHRFESRGAYQFRSLWRAEFFTIDPAANGKITDVAES